MPSFTWVLPSVLPNVNSSAKFPAIYTFPAPSVVIVFIVAAPVRATPHFSAPSVPYFNKYELVATASISLPPKVKLSVKRPVAYISPCAETATGLLLFTFATERISV